jgi:hypothetical protein
MKLFDLVRSFPRCFRSFRSRFSVGEHDAFNCGSDMPRLLLPVRDRLAQLFRPLTPHT